MKKYPLKFFEKSQDDKNKIQRRKKEDGVWGSWVLPTPPKQPPEATPDKTHDLGPIKEERSHGHE